MFFKDLSTYKMKYFLHTNSQKRREKMKHFALIGCPVAQTISPFIHERLFSLSKIKADYVALNVEKNDLKNCYNYIKKLDGYNVTLPYKMEIVKFLDKLDNFAKICGVVNTVQNINKISVGFNTDGNGFLSTMTNNYIKFGEHAVIFGAGGAACAIAHICANCCKKITLLVRKTSLARAKDILKSIIARKTYCKIVDVVLLEDLHKNVDNKLGIKLDKNIDIFINATPLGMFSNNDFMPIGDNILKNCKVVFDTVYNPYETILLKKAKACGATVLSGLEMLVWQAVFAHKIWTGCSFKSEEIFELIEDSKIELKRKFG